jgi:acetyl-CoA C-acetyltransferase
MSEAVIAAPVRTAIGRFGGSLKDLPATELGRIVAVESLARSGIEPHQVDEVIFGNARQAGLGPNPARQVAIGAGIPSDKTAFTINLACGSGMKAIQLGAQAIQSGECEIVLIGGMENQSRIPYYLDSARWGYRLGDGVLVDGQYRDGVFCPLAQMLMGETAEELVDSYHISRREQDEFAAWSQQKAEHAIKTGLFKAEIVPVAVQQRKRDPITIDTDEHPRFGTTVEHLAGLRPLFREGGSVTAGNSSGINDAAACMILLSRKRARQLGVPVMARIIGYSVAGVEPKHMGLGPVPAIHKLLAQTDRALDDFDLIEINEAFAAQMIAVDRELELSRARLNVNGSGIALGHPVGATGARILVTLLHEMQRREARLGLASLCASGGQGLAVAVEAN